MAKQASATRPWTRLAALHPASQKAPTPSSSLSNSPSLKASHAPKISTTDNNKNNNAYTNSTMQPQNHKNTITPSPYASNLKIEVQSEPKALLVQKEFGENKKQLIVHDETKDEGNIPKKNSQNSEDSALGIRAITLAGENRGAYMEIIQSSRKPKSHHMKGNSKINKVHDYEPKGSANGDSKNKNDHHKEKPKLQSPPFGAYINSNVQSANNSLLYYTSSKSNDPGVQITLSRKPYSENEEFHLNNNAKFKQNN